MWSIWVGVCRSQQLLVSLLTYKGGDATSADGGLEVALQLLLDGAGGVKALGEQDDGVDEEEGRDAVDDVLKDLNPRETHGEAESNDFLFFFLIVGVQVFGVVALTPW